MSTLIIRGESDTPGKKDFTKVFLPESEAFAKQEHSPYVKTVHFDNTLPFAKRLPQLIERLKGVPGDGLELDVVAIFCHGWSSGIQAGVRKSNMNRFLDALLKKGAAKNLHVLLYCCSTGDDKLDHPEQAAGSTASDDVWHEGDGSFADTFRDALCKGGWTNCRVTAHTTAGHATENPFVILFDGLGSPVGGIGGILPVTPKNPKMWRAWKMLLKTPFRFEYPFLSVADIHKRVLENV